MVETTSPKTSQKTSEREGLPSATLRHSTTKSSVPPPPPPKKPAPINILVIGPRGSGKTSLINAAGAETEQSTSMGLELCTKKVQGSLIKVGSHNFRLFDTPGFDNTHMSDSEIFMNIVQSLSPPDKPQYRKLTGVLYIHPESDNLGSGTLARNIHALKRLLGEKFISRVTVLMRSTSVEVPDSDVVVRILLSPKSPFNELRDAKFNAFTFERQEIHNILLEYIALKSEMFDVQARLTAGRIKDVKKFIEDGLEQTEDDSVVIRVKKTDLSQDEDIHKLQVASTEWEDERKRLEQTISESDLEAESLRQQLQQIRLEYVSLRTHLQVQENIEQSQIIQKLADINRLIENMGRAVSDHLVDTYSESNTTSLKASDLAGLKNMFGHVEGRSSLAQSSAGAGMPAPDFFDHSIRAILCEQVYKRIFMPFHPRIIAPHTGDSLITSIYRRIQYEESQPVAGRWRRNTFNSISRQKFSVTTTQLKTELANKIVAENISPLFRHYFGSLKNVTLTKEHVSLLNGLISSAWDWNEMLKGSIVLLGDFRPIAYKHGADFNSQSMSEFECKSGEKHPAYILSTIGLGMTVLRAKGGEQKPENIFLCKVSVASERLFE